MRYAGITFNDIVNCPGIGVSVYLQGCDLHCPGCHNSEIWDFDGGKDLGKLATVHPSEDIKMVLYSNVDTAGYQL